MKTYAAPRCASRQWIAQLVHTRIIAYVAAEKWGAIMTNIVGIALVMLGVVIGIFPPKLAGRWGGPETGRQEQRMAIRYYISVVLVIVGSGLQMWAAWPD